MTTFLPLASITIPPDRQRKEFDPYAHADLKQSIQDRGLLSPISIRHNNTLVTGERRFRAVAEIWELGESYQFGGDTVPEGCIPVISLGDISDLEAEECELDENIRRKDLTWQEHANATARLLTLRQEVAREKGEVIPQHYDLAEKFIADGIATSIGQVRDEVKLARNMANPVVHLAKSRNDAIKALNREERGKTNAILAARMGPTFSASNHNLLHGDCFFYMLEMEEGQFDVICTDPPYGMGADTFRDSNGKMGEGAHKYDDSYANLVGIQQQLPMELYRLAKSNAHCYLFCDFDQFSNWRAQMAAAGWKVFRTPFIWFKPTAYRTPWVNLGPQRKYECILYAIKGELLIQRFKGDVIECNPDSNLGNAAQKPVELFTDLLSRSCTPGMSVFDPFCGTGPIFPAAHSLMCRATGIELDAISYGIASERICGLGERK